jgi:hypothetical protein
MRNTLRITSGADLRATAFEQLAEMAYQTRMRGGDLTSYVWEVMESEFARYIEIEDGDTSEIEAVAHDAWAEGGTVELYEDTGGGLHLVHLGMVVHSVQAVDGASFVSDAAGLVVGNWCPGESGLEQTAAAGWLAEQEGLEEPAELVARWLDRNPSDVALVGTLGLSARRYIGEGVDPEVAETMVS